MVKHNSSGRFKRSTQRATSGRVMHLTSPAQAATMERLIQRGPMTIMLVYSTSCPHCHSYMPLWKQLCRQRNRKANMVSMEADVYQQTPMAAKKEVSGVPTVLFVDKAGRITEGEDIRNKRLMSTAVQRGVSEEQLNTQSSSPSTQTLTADSPIFTPTPSASASSEMSLSEPPTPGSRVKANPLHIIPGQTVPSPQVGGVMPIQSGGNPWAAFLSAARQAAPAVALLGAYGMLPSRSSGLGPARRTRRRRSSRRA
jgi:hypothetical protein